MLYFTAQRSGWKDVKQHTMEPDDFSVGTPDSNNDAFDEMWDKCLEDEDADIILSDDYSEEDYE